MSGLMSFAKSGVMFVSPSAATVGPSESLPQLAALGYSYVCYDPKTGEWADERRIAAANGLKVAAWTRVRNLTDLDTLLMAVKRWKAWAIVPNVEIPDTRDATLMQACAKALSTVGRGFVITDGWRDPVGAWAPLARWIIVPECFPEELAAYEDVAGCVSHAAAAGNRPSFPALGAYGTKWKGRLPVRSDYAWPDSQPHLVYPGDSVADWSHWPA